MVAQCGLEIGFVPTAVTTSLQRMTLVENAVQLACDYAADQPVDCASRRLNPLFCFLRHSVVSALCQAQHGRRRFCPRATLGQMVEPVSMLRMPGPPWLPEALRPEFASPPGRGAGFCSPGRAGWRLELQDVRLDLQIVFQSPQRLEACDA